ncbi:hypothetical protein Pla8534_10450 [Lignipirellula cremea]|uniref:Uncharacterized protein n=1 Tax=Lignipirellula cremea TaxID=2528010 RepID=A0A518DN52_9BACT|nr:hypothetical protein Pla8534_10450 [Lignipirellula cremea]
MWKKLLKELESTSDPFEGYRFVLKPDNKTIKEFEQSRRLTANAHYSTGIPRILAR